MSLVDLSVPYQYQQAIAASEAQRQTDVDAANTAFNVPGGFEGNDPAALGAAFTQASSTFSCATSRRRMRQGLKRGVD